MSGRRPGPALERVERDGLVCFTDEPLAERASVRVVFTTRQGGVSESPYTSLDLAGHTGDDPARVDENRRRLLEALGMDPARLVTAEQVHGAQVREVGSSDAGRGASVARDATGPVPGTDALLATEADIPLLMMYADCVPVILVAESPQRAVCVAHAGWKGAIAGLPGIAAVRLAAAAGCEPEDLCAYIGPHVCGRHYEVSDELAKAFAERFARRADSVSILAASARVDLEAAVRASLEEAGLTNERVVALRMCTVEEPTLFYSYRAEGLTGRHGALVAIQA